VFKRLTPLKVSLISCKRDDCSFQTAMSLQSANTFFFLNAYTNELKDLNSEISKRIALIERRITISNLVWEANKEKYDEPPDGITSAAPSSRNPNENDPLMPADKYDKNADCEPSGHTNSSTSVPDSVKAVAVGATHLATSAVTGALSMMTKNEEGTYYTGGFISFKNLSSTNAAIQMVHHARPFTMQAQHAPDSDDGK